MTFDVKMDYNTPMFLNLATFALRIGLIAVFWAFIWRIMEPKTQLLRILRAALLILGLLGILTVLRLVGP